MTAPAKVAGPLFPESEQVARWKAMAEEIRMATRIQVTEYILPALAETAACLLAADDERPASDPWKLEKADRKALRAIVSALEVRS